MDKIPCSVGILTFNSGQTLRRALESVRDFADIILCDGGSSDVTLSIGREYGCRIIPQSVEFQNTDESIRDFSGVRNQCLDAAKYDWFLYIDSDERASRELANEIREIVKVVKAPFVGNVPTKTIIGERVIEYSSGYPGYQHRFFNRKTGARFYKTVHEKVYFDHGLYEVRRLENCWYTYMDGTSAGYYLASTAPYVKMERERLRNMNWRDFLRFGVVNTIRKMLRGCLKTALMYARHGFRSSMPIGIEMGRILSHGRLMLALTVDRFRNIRKRSVEGI